MLIGLVVLFTRDLPQDTLYSLGESLISWKSKKQSVVVDLM